MPRTSYSPRLSDADRAPLSQHERIQWAGIRDAALDAFDRGETYSYHDGRTTHRCETIDALARVTRAERRRAGVRWAEDR